MSPSRTLLVEFAGSQSGFREISRDELLGLFKSGDLWVVNETRVLKRRVFTKQNLEILFIRPLNSERTEWEVLCPSSRWKDGARQSVGSVEFELLERGRPQKLRSSVALLEDFFEQAGELPLPPYIQKARGERHTRTEDDQDYQSMWRAPKAQRMVWEVWRPRPPVFHFDEAFVAELKSLGVEVATVTLHVGLGTFLPVTVENLDDHVMHAEFAEISEGTQTRSHKRRPRAAE